MKRLAQWIWAWLPELVETCLLLLLGMVWWMVAARLPVSFTWLPRCLPAWLAGPVMAHLRLVLWLLGAER